MTCKDLPEQMALEGKPPKGSMEASERVFQDDPPTPPQTHGELWEVTLAQAEDGELPPLLEGVNFSRDQR